MITMVIDHIGFLFFPQVMIFRIIGRIAFPLFAYLLARGFHVTSNKQKYLARLIIAGIISQPIFMLFTGGNDINIFGTLALGFLAIWTLGSNIHKYKKILLCGCIALISIVVPIEYGVIGVGTMVSFYFIKNYYHLIGIQGILWILYMMYESLLQYGNIHLDISRITVVQLFAILIPVMGMVLRVPIQATRDIQVTSSSRNSNVFKKYGWYLFYPLHMMVLIVIYFITHS